MVRDWREVLGDALDSGGDPSGWSAVSGSRKDGPGRELYLAHPGEGVFLVKTYAKNPFEVKGVGSRVARRVDDDIEPLLPGRDSPGRFSVQTPPTEEREAEERLERMAEVLEGGAEGDVEATEFFDELMEASGSPAFGPSKSSRLERPEEAGELEELFEEEHSLLNSELDDLIQGDGLDRDVV